MAEHDIVLRVIASVAGAAMFIAGLIGTVRQGFWKH
jgi:hypothetical protein